MQVLLYSEPDAASFWGCTEIVIERDMRDDEQARSYMNRLAQRLAAKSPVRYGSLRLVDDVTDLPEEPENGKVYALVVDHQHAGALMLEGPTNATLSSIAERAHRLGYTSWQLAEITILPEVEPVGAADH